MMKELRVAIVHTCMHTLVHTRVRVCCLFLTQYAVFSITIYIYIYRPIIDSLRNMFGRDYSVVN